MCYLGFPANAPSEQPTAEAAKERPPAPYADEFMMWCFKVVECDNPEHTRDDWDTCPFAHVGEVVTRRPPQTHLPKLCPKARRACRKGRACPYAHNVFEHWLHPSRFKTEICEHGASCTRPMCFFAHNPEEVRHPSPSADEVMAAAESAGLLSRSHGHSNGHSCGGSRCSGSCHDGSSVCSRRSSSTNHSDLSGHFASAPWLAQPAMAAALQPRDQQQRLYQQINADLTFAKQCLQAQRQAQSAAAAAIAAATAGWPAAEWGMLSSGAGRLMPGSRDDSPAAGLMGAMAGLGTTSVPLPSAGPFNLWPAALQPPALPSASAAGGGPALGGLSSDEALLLLAGIPGSATSNYLCALQAERARAATLARAAAFY